MTNDTNITHIHETPDWNNSTGLNPFTSFLSSTEMEYSGKKDNGTQKGRYVLNQEKSIVFQNVIREMVGSQYRGSEPPLTMQAKIKRTGEIEDMCDDLIEKAHEERNGKIRVAKTGAVRDENGHRVEAFAFHCGEYYVDQTLYTGLVVDMLRDYVTTLLIRSDVTAAKHKLFPNIGTPQDWQVLLKCAARFSPKAASHRYNISVREAQHTTAELGAMHYLEWSGALRQSDLDILQDMEPAKLHLLDLGAITALSPNFPDQVSPRMIHVIVTRDADDLDEIQRVFRALDFTIGVQSSGMYVPSVRVTGKKGLELWRKSARFAYMTYDKPQGIECLFTAMAQSLTIHDAEFSKEFPFPSVVVGPNVWSDRACVEIDMRGVRFSDDELLVGRKYVALLLKYRAPIMKNLFNYWKESFATPEAVLKPYQQVWFQAFHFAIGTVFFSGNDALMDYLQLTREADAARLRLRDDRKARYDAAIDKLRSANSEAPWLYSAKPSTRAEALSLLNRDYDAFLHQKDGRPVLAFTAASLIRCANLERQEIDDFVSKLKENHLLTNKTHPITFKNREQHRFICVLAESITVTGENR